MEPKINKKRVLFVITQNEFGGAQRFLNELIVRLDWEKYEIMVAVGKSGGNGLLESLAGKKINAKPLRFLRRDVNPFFDALAIIELMMVINGFKPDYLYLLSSKAGVLGSIVGLKIKLLRPKKFKNLKIIYRIGGWSFNDPGPLWKKKIFILAEKITAKFKDIIVVNNKSDYKQALKLKIKPKGELKFIHNGIDAIKIEFLSRDEARLKLDVSRNNLIIGTTANFYPTKGLEYLIEAVRILNTKYNILNTKYLIIGDGKEREKLESLIKGYGLEKEIILLGQIPEARKFIKAFDIFILPSVKEGFPWSVLDAMAAKLPIIATNIGALPEIIEDGKNGILVEPKNPQQLAEAMKYLIENERIRQEFGIQAHQTVLFKFPIEKMVSQIEKLL